MPVNQGQALNSPTAMETILAIISSLFAGTTIFQFIFIRSQRKKIAAEASQEGAKADGLNLSNIKEMLELQGKQLVESEKRNGELSKENDILRQKLREYDYKLEQFERKVKGVERVVGIEIARRIFAENNICLRKGCDEREPELGAYKPEEK